MPIAKIQLPDGRIGKFKVPEGTTEEQVMSFANEQFGQEQQPTAPKNNKFFDMNADITPYRRSASKDAGDLIKGIYSGLGDVGTGIYQTAADVGLDFSGAKNVLSLIRPDLKEQLQSLTSEDISQVLADKQKVKNSSEKDNSLLFRGAKEVTKIAPYLGVGAGRGLIVGGAESGAAMFGLAPQEEAGLENRAGETVKGTATGAGVGAAFKALGVAAPAAANSISSMVKRLTSTPSGEQILGKIVKPQDAGRLANKLEARQGRESILPDIAGDEVAGLTRLLAKTSGSKNIIDTALNNRTATSSRRVANLINKNVSNEAYFGSIDDLIKARAEVAGPLYKKAYAEGNNIAPAAKGDNVRRANIEELIDDERISSAINTARKDFGIQAPDASIETLHGARQVIDDIIEASKRDGKNNKARSYKDLKNKINSILYKVSPTLKEADNTFSGFSSIKSAQEAGSKFNRLRPEQLQKEFSALNAGERDAYKIGVRENLMKTLEQTTDGSSAARRLFAKPENRDRLKVIFNNQKEYNDFSTKMFDEIRIFDTKNRILGGSRTDINLADEAQIIDKFAQGASSPKLAILSAVTNSIKKRYIGLNDKNSAELARILISKEKSIDALRNIAKKADKDQLPVVQKFIDDTIPTILSRGTTKSVGGSNNDAQAASTDNLTEEQIRAQLIDANNQNMKQGLPQAYTAEEIQNNPSLIKKRYYK